MLGLTRRKAPDEEEFEAARLDVDERLARGDYVGATQAAGALRRAFEVAEAHHTLGWARAHALEARAELTTSDTDSALEHMRAACEIHSDEAQSIEARLEHEMRLGDLLAELDQLEEAEVVHRRALQERGSFYGAEHPQFGFGAESLGIVLLRRGDFDGAAELADKAAEAFRGGEANKLGAALILSCVARKASDPAASVLDTLDEDDRGRVVSGMKNTPAYLFAGSSIDLRWEVLDHLEDPQAQRECLAKIEMYAQALDRVEDVERAVARRAELES